MKSVMLTGATGFIGSHVAERLIRKKIVPHLFIRRRINLINSLEKKGAKIYVAQPDNLETLKKSLQNADTVIHCAGATKALSERGFIKANVAFTNNILNLLGKQQKLIFISSQAAAGPSNSLVPIDEGAEPSPLTHYGKSKLLAEDCVRKWGKENDNNYVILRPSIVYGPGERNLYKAFKLIKKGLFLLPGSGKINLSIIHVEDLVNAIMTAAENSATGEIYFISSNEGHSWEEIGESIRIALNRTYLVGIKLPIPLAYPAAYFFDLMSFITRKPSLFNSQKIIEMKQSAWLCSNRKIKEQLGWEPELSLENGIKQTAGWYIKENWI